MDGYVRTEHCIPLMDIMDMLEDIPLSVMAEVMTAVRDYCRYWDEWETDEGFELPEMSVAARVAWNGVKKRLKASNEKYFYFVERQREKSEKAVAVRRSRQEKRERDRRYYSENKEEINQRRRQKYAAAAVDKFEETSEKEADEEQNLSFVSPKALTDESPLNHTEKGIAENLPAGDRIIGLHNNLVKHSVVIEERGYGGKQVIHRPVVDNPPDNHPSDGLTGNNPAAGTAEGSNRRLDAGNKPDPPDADPAAESAGKPKPDALAAMGKGQWEAQAFGLPAEGREMPETGNVPPEGGNKRPPTRPSPGAGEGESSASVHVRGGGWASGRNATRGEWWGYSSALEVNGLTYLAFNGKSLIDLWGGRGGHGTGTYAEGGGDGGKLEVGTLKIVSSTIKSAGRKESTSSLLQNGFGAGGKAGDLGENGAGGTNGYVKIVYLGQV